MHRREAGATPLESEVYTVNDCAREERGGRCGKAQDGMLLQYTMRDVSKKIYGLNFFLK